MPATLRGHHALLGRRLLVDVDGDLAASGGDVVGHVLEAIELAHRLGHLDRGLGEIGLVRAGQIDLDAVVSAGRVLRGDGDLGAIGLEPPELLAQLLDERLRGLHVLLEPQVHRPWFVPCTPSEKVNPLEPPVDES